MNKIIRSGISIFLILIMIFSPTLLVSAIEGGIDESTQSQYKNTDYDDNGYSDWKADYVQKELHKTYKPHNSSGSLPSENITVSDEVYYAELYDSEIYSTGMVSNEYLKVAVGDSGKFTIGTVGGDPDSPLDDNMVLLYET